MTTLEEKFRQAREESKTLSKRPDNETLLSLYALFKQGSVGNAPAEGPSNPFDIVGKAKYEAWAALSDLTSEEAQQRYVDLVARLKANN